MVIKSHHLLNNKSVIFPASYSLLLILYVFIHPFGIASFALQARPGMDNTTAERQSDKQTNERKMVFKLYANTLNAI